MHSDSFLMSFLTYPEILNLIPSAVFEIWQIHLLDKLDAYSIF
jgi:hypothetical protein